MNIQRYLGFTFAFAALAIGISGILFLSIKPDLPFECRELNNRIEASENYSDLIKQGDIINEFSGIKINELNQVEFLSDMYNIGDEVSMKIQSSGSEKSLIIKLDKAYRNGSFLYISSIIGIAFWFLGLFVYFKKKDDITASILFIMLISFSIATMTSPGKFNDSIFSYYTLIKALHLFAYVGGISFLVHFSLIFPKRIYSGKFLISLIYILPFSFGVLMNIVQLNAIANKDIMHINLYYKFWVILLLILLTGIVWSITNFSISFFSHREDIDRRKVQWALWGILIGVSPYILLWVIPNLLNYTIPVKEEYSLAFLIFVPISFVIGVLKYKLFDIEFIFSKSIVYGTMTLLITGVFFLIVYILSNLFSSVIGKTLPIYSFVSAIFIAIIFNPLRIRIQKFVDKNFYKVKYDFRKSLKKLNINLAECNTTEELGNILISEINDIIPASKSAILLEDESGGNYKLLASKNISNKNPVEIITEIKYSGFAASVPLMLQPDKEKGIIMLGEKLSGIKYLDSDFEILKVFADNAASLMNRIELREKIIKSEMEKKRLEELNQMKSEFVSSVSHELKTPLTSIQLFAETLMSGKEIKKEKQKEYAEIIYGESERLTRIINNILDFSKIERGIKQYYFENICINNVVEYVLNSMEYQFRKNNVDLIKNICEKKIIINADRDAIAESIINLLSNAIKYSGENPSIEVTLSIDVGNVILSIKDNGKGIEETELKRIFEKFYRIKKETETHIGGAGIGLAIVKNIMTAHKGDIKVQSEVGKGSTFSLIFKNLEN